MSEVVSFGNIVNALNTVRDDYNDHLKSIPQYEAFLLVESSTLKVFETLHGMANSSAPSMAGEVIASLEIARTKFREHLTSVPEYRALLAIDKLIRDVSADLGVQPVTTAAQAEFAPGYPVKVSQSDVAEQASKAVDAVEPQNAAEQVSAAAEAVSQPIVPEKQASAPPNAIAQPVVAEQASAPPKAVSLPDFAEQASTLPRAIWVSDVAEQAPTNPNAVSQPALGEHVSVSLNTLAHLVEQASTEASTDYHFDVAEQASTNPDTVSQTALPEHVSEILDALAQSELLEDASTHPSDVTVSPASEELHPTIRPFGEPSAEGSEKAA